MPDDPSESNPIYLIVESKGKWLYLANHGNNVTPTDPQSGLVAYTITSPFQLANPRGQPKYAVLQIVTATDAGAYKESEIRDQIRAQLSDERSIRHLLDDMRKQTYVSLRM